MATSGGALVLMMAIAQAPASAGGQGARVRSPEVAADRRVTFRLRAPRAKEVLVRGLFFQDRVPLSRGQGQEGDGEGLWSATIGPVEPGIYEYNFSVDGLTMLDPMNPAVEPSPVVENSILEVPGTPPLLTELQDVPHGTVHVHHYRARSFGGRARRIHVYTPPGYQAGRTGVRLPVLYLLHGAGGNDATWSVYGRANFMLDNLLAQKKVQPMIVVMPDGHSRPPGSTTPGPDGRRPDNSPDFMRELLTDVLPLVERHYRVRRDGSGRAIAGLSMGGRQALTVGLNHPDRFGWVASMGGSIPPDGTIAAPLDAAALNRKLRWLWIACGSADGGFKRNQDFVALLAKRGIRHLWHPTGGGHRWPVWRAYFAEIAPQLFAASARSSETFGRRRQR
jgi:enterochelin esterase-like enzyme